MAEDQDNRTEPATEQRLRRAREEGQVAVGHDAPLVAGVAAAAVTLVALAGPLQASLLSLLRESAAQVSRAPFATLPGLLARPGLVVLAIAAAAALAAATVTLAQTQAGFWPERVAPDLDRLFQPQRFSRIVSLEALLDLLLATAKVAFVSAAVWLSARDELLGLTGLLRAEPSAQLGAAFGLVRAAAKPALAAAVVLAVAEWAITRGASSRRCG